MSNLISRRDLLRGRTEPPRQRICPPGVTLSDLTACSGCGKCVEQCPTKIISMVDRLPALDFSKGECTFCSQCAAACPEPVFKVEPAAHFDHAMVIGDDCLAFQKVDCQACRDACPTQAIRFRPRLGGPFIPELNETRCTGCGACVSVCPANVIEINERSAEVQYG